MNTIFRLSIYFSSTDKMEHELLSEFLVHEAHRLGLAGATAVRGIIGFGASSVIHSVKFWEVSDKVPVIFEVLDEENKVLAFFEKLKPRLESMQYGCLATIEPCNMLMHKAGKKKRA